MEEKTITIKNDVTDSFTFARLSQLRSHLFGRLNTFVFRHRTFHIFGHGGDGNQSSSLFIRDDLSIDMFIAAKHTYPWTSVGPLDFLANPLLSSPTALNSSIAEHGIPRLPKLTGRADGFTGFSANELFLVFDPFTLVGFRRLQASYPGGRLAQDLLIERL